MEKTLKNFKRNSVNPNLAGSQGCDLLENEWFQYSGVVDISACVDIGSVIIYKKDQFCFFVVLSRQFSTKNPRKP